MTEKRMNSAEKRSCGSYGLRTVAKKKKLCEDFEYYFIKTEPPDSNVDEEVDPRETDNANMEEVQREDDENCENETDNENHVVPTYYLCTTDNLPSSHSLEVETTEYNDGCNVLFVETLDNEEVITAVISEEAEKLQGAVESVKQAMVHAVKLHRDNIEKVHKVSQSDVTENSPVVERDEESADNVGIVVQSVNNSVIQSSEKTGAVHKYNELVHKLSHLHPDDKVECSKCHKLLKPASFRQHLRTHSGEKPHGCKMCPSRFTRKGDVDRHVRIVHEKQKPFKCFKCTRTFGERKNLHWHLVNHDKKLFYVCHVCDFKFGKREYWENHVRYIHPLEDDATQALSDNSPPQESDTLNEVENSEADTVNKTDLPLPIDCTILRLNDDKEKQLPSEGIEAVVIRFDENGTVCSSEVGHLSVRNNKDGSVVHVVESNDEESESNVFEVTVQDSENDDEQEGVVSILMGEDVTDTHFTHTRSEEEYLDAQCV